MSFSETVISILGGGAIGYFVKYYLDLQLAKQSEAMAQKRKVYGEIATALGIFVSGRDSTTEDKKRFLDQYAKLWLWASDSVIRAANEFSDIMMEFDASNKEDQRKAKHAYANFVMEMRKDLGFSKTQLRHDEYKFVSFGA